jgi:mannose-6-phosphate isomerase-like protein (cupin superfamily)
MLLEQSRAKHVQPGQGKTFRARGDLFFFKVVGADNDDAFSMCEVWNAPQGGVPPHIDHRDDEAFFVLEGTYDCRLGDCNLTCGPGESFFAPRGTPHAFKNVGDTGADADRAVARWPHREVYRGSLGEDRGSFESTAAGRAGLREGHGGCAKVRHRDVASRVGRRSTAAFDLTKVVQAVARHLLSRTCI